MRLSIIICTLNRKDKLGNCLNSLQAALHAAQPLSAEVIVVDNGSSDGTLEMLNEKGRDFGCNLSILSVKQAGLSRARNEGLRRAVGDMFILTDDDCQFDESYFICISKYFSQSNVLRGGRVELGNAQDLPLTVIRGLEPRIWSKSKNDASNFNLGNSLLGCNFIFSRRIYEALGGFDERLGTGTRLKGGEDIDYIIKAYEAGFSIEYCPDLVVHHFHGRSDKDEGLSLLKNYAVGGGALYSKYIFSAPKHCRQLLWDIKGVFNESIYCRNRYLPEFSFSLKDKLFYNFKGMLLFSIESFKLRISSIFK